MRRLLNMAPKSPLPLVDGDLPIGLTPEEARELSAMQALASIKIANDDDVPGADGAAAVSEENDAAASEKREETEEKQISPVTVHTVSRTESVQLVTLEKSAGSSVGIILGRAGRFGGVDVRDVKQGSALIGAVFEGDTVIAINNTCVSDVQYAASLLRDAGGKVTLKVSHKSQA